jgi:3-deoxy-manno-octulosonate cytidylyltransferase (CMP-KDO synthetase)
MNIHIVIPARFASTRLPGKPLADIAGEPMIVRVAAQAARSMANDVVVAVDDQRVADVVIAAGWQAEMTREDHASGSDRVMEVASRRGWSDDDIVINVQGDEPLVPPQVIDQLCQGMLAQPEVAMATLSELISDIDDFLNPNVVKVVADDAGLAMTFSRSPVPYPRDAEGRDVPDGAARHVGIYGFRVSALRRFIALGESSLEGIEKLEQLRWLQASLPLLVLQAEVRVPGGVDTPDDLARVQALFSA